MSIFTSIKSKLSLINHPLPKWGKFCTIPAGWVDECYAKNPTSKLGYFYQMAKARVAFTAFFPILSLIDFTAALTLSIYNKVRAFTSQEPQSGEYDKAASKKYVLATKNLLGFLAFPLGIIFPKLISLYFCPTRPTKGQIVSGGELYTQESTILYPESSRDVQAILQQANQENKKVTIVGAGRSQGKQFIPENDQSLVIDMKKLNHVQINPEEKTAIVGAGASWADLQNQANDHQLAIKVMQASNVFSVGGSLSTNIHGWHKCGTLAKTVKRLKIVTPQGEVQNLKPEDELFGYVLGGLGQFGVILEAELELTDNELLLERSIRVNPSVYFDYFKDNVVNNPEKRMHLYRLSLDPDAPLADGIAVNYTANHQTTVNPTENYTQEPKHGTRIERILINLARHFGILRKLYWKFISYSLLNSETKITTNQIMQPPINAMFNKAVSESEWLQEFFVPGDNLEAFLKDMGALLKDNDVPLINATVRYVPQDDIAKMPYANGEDRFALVLCFNQSLKHDEIIKTRKWVQAAIDLSIKHGGTYYLPYQQFATNAQFNAAYPQAELVREKKQEIDPNAILSSGFSNKYLGTQQPKRNIYQEILSTQQGKQEFAPFLDNILQRVDKDKFYQLMDDILSYTDDRDEIYSELKKRIPEIAPSFLGTASNIYTSLRDIKSELTGQVVDLYGSDENQNINGILEIGYPGRFINSLKEQFNVSGQISVMHEAESMADVVQSGLPKPYHQFVPINDYAPFDETVLKPNSVDMVTCFIGLHHIPEDKLDGFLSSIRRVLRPGGSLLLVDHDVKDQKTHDMASLAHSVYNAVMGVSEEEEKHEIRNFQSLEHWATLLEQHGFGKIEVEGKTMVRKDDPSKNTMLRFVNNKVLSPAEQAQVNQDKLLLAANDSSNFGAWISNNMNRLKWSAVGSLITTMLSRIVLATTWFSSGLVGAGAFIAQGIGNWLRDKFSQQQYQDYKTKDDHKVAELNETQRAAFDIGAKAAKSYTATAASLFMWQAYKAPKAFYAGNKAGALEDQELINKIANNRPA